MLKDKSGYCPKCGGIWDVIGDQVEFSSEDYIKIHHKCGCGAEWDEYYYVQYTGYAYEGRDYDVDGEEQVYGMSEEEAEFSSYCQVHECDTCPYNYAADCMVAYLNDRAGEALCAKKEESEFTIFCKQHECDTCPYDEANDCVVAYLCDKLGADEEDMKDFQEFCEDNDCVSCEYFNRKVCLEAFLKDKYSID